MEDDLNWLDQKDPKNQENINNGNCKIIVDQEESSISSNEYGASNEEWFNSRYNLLEIWNLIA